MRAVPLFGTGHRGASPIISAQQRTNLYLVPESDPDKGPYHLACTPGLTQWCYLGTWPSRGAIAVDGYIYTVHNDTLFRVDSNAAANPLGTIDTGVGPVSFAWNGLELCLVDGQDGWIWDGTTLAKITAPGFPANPQSVAFLAARFVVNEGGSGRIWWSGLLDGTAWDALDFATAESETDDLIAIAADHGVLLLLGVRTTEFWRPTEDNRIFAPIGASAAEWGCAAIQTITKFDTGLAWLAKSQQGEVRVVRNQGGQIVPLDTPEVASDLNARDAVADATAFSYVIDGRGFLQINFADKSFLFDGIGWGYVSSGTTGGRHLANFRAALSEEPYVFSYSTGMVYRLDKNSLTDGSIGETDGALLVREVVTRHVVSDFNPITVWELYVNCEVGVNQAPALTHVPPQMMLQVSKDGGQTWGNEMWASMGNLGAYSARVIWRRLGRARDWVFRMRVTDDVRVLLTAAAMTAE